MVHFKQPLPILILELGTSLLFNLPLAQILLNSHHFLDPLHGLDLLFARLDGPHAHDLAGEHLAQGTIFEPYVVDASQTVNPIVGGNVPQHLGEHEGDGVQVGV